ncbi:MAG: hypothetical protein WC556_09475 [Candidatus Methanoperedens sp.]
MNEYELQTSKNHLCGTCGEILKEKNGELVCETCEHFFGTSGVIDECYNCNNKFAHFPAIDETVFITLPSGAPVLSKENRKTWRTRCPACRKTLGSFYCYIGNEGTYEETTKEIIRVLIKSASATIRDLEFRGIPKEFIEYCIGKIKPIIPQPSVKSMAEEQAEKDRLADIEEERRESELANETIYRITINKLFKELLERYDELYDHPLTLDEARDIIDFFKKKCDPLLKYYNTQNIEAMTNLINKAEQQLQDHIIFSKQFPDYIPIFKKKRTPEYYSKVITNFLDDQLKQYDHPLNLDEARYIIKVFPKEYIPLLKDLDIQNEEDTQEAEYYSEAITNLIEKAKQKILKSRKFYTLTADLSLTEVEFPKKP